MELLSNLVAFKKSSGPIALAIGNFDGVHLGHQRIIEEIVKNPDLKSVVMSFEPHPIIFLNPQLSFKKLFPLSDQEQVFTKMKVQYFVRLKFNAELAEMTYKEFLSLIHSHLDIKKIVVGYDFRFGKNKEGTIDKLSQWCQKNNIEFKKIEEVKMGAVTISTSDIKRRLISHDLKEVNKMLGRNYYLSGVVVRGDQRGRLLGFPTANMLIEEDLQVPALGVYVTQVTLGQKNYLGVTNIGKTPTFKNDERIKIETHILDFNQDIYEQTIAIEFLRFLRDEKKFSSIDEIKFQIAKDIEESQK